jgi:hypothetical protein
VIFGLPADALLGEIAISDFVARVGSSRKPIAGVETEFVSLEGSPYRNVDDFVALKAPKFNSNQQTSTSSPQQVQHQSVTNNRIQQISISLGIWFGTRGSEVQILSPRPKFPIKWQIRRHAVR